MTFVNTEDKFGIKIQSARAPRTLEQKLLDDRRQYLRSRWNHRVLRHGFAQHYRGDQPLDFSGIFMLNPFHNIVHIALGGLWLLAAFALTPAGTEGMNVAIGGTYALATVLGFFGYFSLLSIPAGASGDNFLHLVTALVTLVFGCGLLRAMGGAQAATA